MHRYGGGASCAVTLVHFESEARFERDDLVLITRTLSALVEASSLGGWSPAAAAAVSGALKWLLAVAGVVRPLPVSPVMRRPSGSGARFGDTGPVQRLIDVATERVLDHAASLLDASVLLHRGDLHVSAFALEGIHGRLLEAAVGAGSVERPW